jgi:membrane associated rhomboid family serine protease
MTNSPESQQNQSANGREPAIMLPGVITALLGLMIAVHIARVFVLNNEGSVNLIIWFAFLPVRFIAPSEVPGGLLPLIWTPFSYAFLHSGWEHLLINSAWLAIFGTPVARRYGTVATLVVFFVSGVAGAALFALTTLPEPQIMIGASGAIAGLTGAACRFMFQPVIVARDPETGATRVLGRKTASLMELAREGRARFFILIWLVLNAAVPFLPMLIGEQSGIAWQAHLGGFIAGLLLPPLLERRPREVRS